MLCPTCGTRVPDGSLRCPACGCDLDGTRRISLDESAWCPSCGALVSRGAAACPKCGAALASGSRARELDLPDIEADPSAAGEGASVVTHIESAIPTPGEGASSSFYRRERAPRTRRVLVAAVLAVVVVGGAALLITHPWDPDAYSTSATTPADTSLAGFPGFFEYLTGQDDVAATGDDATDDASEEEAEVELTVAEQAHEAWEELGALADRVALSEEALAADGVAGDADARASGYDNAYAIAIELSNLIAEIDGLDAGDDDELADALADLDTLGNWLRNRVDALVDAWVLSCSYDDASAHADDILATLAAADAYLGYFETYYDAWEPEA